ncbi:Os02g0603900 [Oryza sativa Japonica Group]|uniref:Os02g0603900 protein n=1 Tax=Oryza sativa subsp. japonica TaxID=39947 RepID=A0A0P0VLG6_ORYSJ|nr:hypothetical protein EE612_012271 [Oryza sativa]BAS79643.1 Os02g0603900 [Oryza sativa Japonica Group]
MITAKWHIPNHHSAGFSPPCLIYRFTILLPGNKSGLPSEDGSSSMVSEPVLELLATSTLPLDEPTLRVAGTDKILAKSTLLVKPMPPSRTLTCGSGAGATPVAMAISKHQLLG